MKRAIAHSYSSSKSTIKKSWEVITIILMMIIIIIFIFKYGVSNFEEALEI